MLTSGPAGGAQSQPQPQNQLQTQSQLPKRARDPSGGDVGELEPFPHQRHSELEPSGNWSHSPGPASGVDFEAGVDFSPSLLAVSDITGSAGLPGDETAPIPEEERASISGEGRDPIPGDEMAPTAFEGMAPSASSESAQVGPPVLPPLSAVLWARVVAWALGVQAGGGTSIPGGSTSMAVGSTFIAGGSTSTWVPVAGGRPASEVGVGWGEDGMVLLRVGRCALLTPDPEP